jgi:DNA polymerase-3 subunit delta
MAQNIRDIISDIRKREAKPVYLLMGEEAYYLDLLVENFESYAIDPADKDFNYNLFYGNDADLDVVIASAQQFPVMAPRKLVMLKEAQSMFNAKNQLDKFATYVAKPNPNSILVIVFKGESLNATSALMKAASKNPDVVVFKSDKIKDWTLPSHIKDYCGMRKVAIEDKAVQLLCDYIGLPLTKVFGEINKLIQIIGQNGRITCDVIEKNIGISKDFNTFELCKALSEKDYAKCMQIVQYFENNPKSNPSVLISPNIFNTFSRLVIAHYLPDKSDASLMTNLGLKSQPAVREVKTGLRNYNALQAVNAIHYIREYDAKSKGIGSYQNEHELLKELVFKIVGG